MVIDMKDLSVNEMRWGLIADPGVVDLDMPCWKGNTKSEIQEMMLGQLKDNVLWKPVAWLMIPATFRAAFKGIPDEILKPAWNANIKYWDEKEKDGPHYGILVFEEI